MSEREILGSYELLFSQPTSVYRAEALPAAPRASQGAFPLARSPTPATREARLTKRSAAAHSQREPTITRRRAYRSARHRSRYVAPRMPRSSCAIPRTARVAHLSRPLRALSTDTAG